MDKNEDCCKQISINNFSKSKTCKRGRRNLARGWRKNSNIVRGSLNGCIAYIDDIENLGDNDSCKQNKTNLPPCWVKIRQRGGNRQYVDKSPDVCVEVHQSDDTSPNNESVTVDEMGNELSSQITGEISFLEPNPIPRDDDCHERFIYVSDDSYPDSNGNQLKAMEEIKDRPELIKNSELVEQSELAENSELMDESELVKNSELVDNPNFIEESESIEESVTSNDCVETIYVPGEMLWVKIGSYPFWPCLVTYHPGSDSVYKKQVKKYGKLCTLYHVQYFGEKPQRGWTTGGNILPYEGKQQFMDLCSKYEKSGQAKRFKIKEIWKKDWDCAVEEAEEAFEYDDIYERLEDYTFDYGSKKKASVKRVAKDSSDEDEASSSKISAPKVKKPKPSKDLEPLCSKCAKKNTEISCSGDCRGFFHLKCVGQIDASLKYKCEDCTCAEQQPCFACKEKEEDVVKCSNSKCNKSYHVRCLSELEGSIKDKFVCPLHTCITCFRDSPNNKKCRKGSLSVCIRCPTAFHSREECIAAGSKEISSSTLICPYHFQFRKDSLKYNINICTSCGKGGELVCCETCPNAFHQNCVENGIPTDAFFCEDCISKRHLLNGMIVWTRFAKYRWWPAKIVPFSEVPENVKNLNHNPGEFVVMFFGSHDYAWVHSKCTFPYDEDHKEVIAGSSTKEVYKKSLREAAQAYDEYLAEKASKSSLHPDPYKSILTNRARAPAVIMSVADVQSLMQCSCDPSKENPCADRGCLNRGTFFECHPDVCKAGEKCQNRDFIRRNYASTKVVKTPECGWGLAAAENIPKGKFIIEYVGEVITQQEYKTRAKISQSNYYFLHLDAQRLIDAGPMGNLSRFINHSCDPNCEMEKWSVNGDARIGIFATKDIPAGEELTFDYQADNNKYEFEQKCLCRAKNCQGFIGRKTQAYKQEKLASKKPNKKKLKNTDRSTRLPAPKSIKISKSDLPEFSDLNSDVIGSDEWSPYVKLDNFELKDYNINHVSASFEMSKNKNQSKDNESETHCFICKKTGTLIICDKKKCIRAYHLSCVGLPAVPEGIWICPHHMCNICEKEARVLCKGCPTSFCSSCWIYKKPDNFTCQICKIKKKAKLLKI